MTWCDGHVTWCDGHVTWYDGHVEWSHDNVLIHATIHVTIT